MSAPAPRCDADDYAVAVIVIALSGLIGWAGPAIVEAVGRWLS